MTNPMTRRAIVAAIVLAASVPAWAEGPEAAAPAEAHARADFTIGVEDQLRIVVWGEPELSLTVVVRPDGKITIPLIHDVLVDGLTPEEVRLAVTNQLGGFVRDPNVTVIVEKINSFKVFFVGEVKTPGVLQLFRPTRVLQAVAMAGGPTEFSKKDVTLLREEYGGEKRIPIDDKKLVAGDPSQENIYLRPGDTLVFK